MGKVVVGLVIDAWNYDEDNTDPEKVYASNYFSSYNGTLVIRHSSEHLTSWALFDVIWLNHDLDPNEEDPFNQDHINTLNHEYGHILQEKEFGTKKYIGVVFVPSATYNLLSRYSDSLRDNYHNMPWEYDADMRGGVNRGYAPWAQTVSNIYWAVWR